METSEQIDQVAAALSVAQGEIETVLKSGENSFFKRADGTGSRYATLADCVRATHTHLSKNKLCLIQGIHGSEFFARLAHASGQWIQLRIPVPGDISKMNAQQLGSATTYLRRQTYSLIGLAPDEDDDGNEAAKVGTFKKTTKPTQPGWGVHSPLGDLDPAVESLAVKYAAAFLKTLTPTDAHKVESDMNNERDDSDQPWGDVLKVSVWAKLDSKARSRIKTLLAQQAAA